MSAYKNLFDTHLHTEWSGDSSTPVLDQINRAKELGLSGITITDHMDLDFPETPDRFKLDLPNYLSTLKKIALQESSPDFEILIGMELGLQPQCVDDNHSLLRNYNFDYIIGSLHLIDGMDPYYDSFYEGKSVTWCYETYFTSLLANIKQFSDFDSLGHMDYIARYAKRIYGEEEARLSYSMFPELFDEIFHFLIRRNISLEVNTGGMQHGLPEPNPSYELLQRYYDLGGRMITLGADSHTTAHVGLNFPSVVSDLKKIGFEGQMIYRRRNAEFNPF